MQLFPNEADRQPKITNYYVPSSFECASGFSKLTLVESEDSVQARMERNYPIYRLVQLGKNAVQQFMNGGKHEI